MFTSNRYLDKTLRSFRQCETQTHLYKKVSMCQNIIYVYVSLCKWNFVSMDIMKMRMFFKNSEKKQLFPVVLQKILCNFIIDVCISKVYSCSIGMSSEVDVKNNFVFFQTFCCNPLCIISEVTLMPIYKKRKI